VHTIQPTSDYPAVIDPIFLDGYTQPGASPNSLASGNNAVLRIEIDATQVIGSFGLFRMGGSGGSTIRGLVVNRLVSPVMNVGFNGDQSSNNVFAGNFVGTSPTGTTRLGGAATFQAIQLNGGTANRIGGSAPADRNLIVGGSLFLNSGVLGTLIQGNYFGTNAAGTQSLAIEGLSLIHGQGPGTVVGGASAGNLLVTEANALGIGADDWVVTGNRIGTDVTGTVALASGSIGIDVRNAASRTRIGGPGAAGNLISGFVFGIQIGDSADDSTVQGNKLGTDLTGTLPIPNGDGIRLGGPSAGSVVGGTGAGEGNVVAFNTGIGVRVTSGTGWAILGNSIFGNGGLGISQISDGTPAQNDPGDADEGSNRLQNYPLIGASSDDGSTVTLEGELDSAASTTFRLEIFASSACHSSGFGQGRTFVGTLDVTTNGSGDATFGPLAVAVPAGRKAMTLTATDPDGNTSEFSPCVVAGTLFLDGFESGDTSRWSAAVP
jgi:titin